MSSMMVYWKRSWPSQDSPEISRYHSHQAEIVTRARYFTERCTKITGQYTIMLLMILAACLVHHMSVLSPELSRYHANDAEIGTKTTGHDRFQYTIMLLTIRAARFVHRVLVLSPRLSRYHSRTVTFHPTRR